MKTKTKTILKYLPQYDEIMQETNAPLSRATTYTTYCGGWLSGAKAAIDAILDDSSIGLMVYNAIQEQSRAEDVKEHLVDFYSYELCLKEEEVEKKLKTAAQDGTIDAITCDFLDHYNADIPEYDQIDTAIENYYADKVV
jgi:hypothetical protein